MNNGRGGSGKAQQQGVLLAGDRFESVRFDRLCRRTSRRSKSDPQVCWRGERSNNIRRPVWQTIDIGQDATTAFQEVHTQRTLDEHVTQGTITASHGYHFIESLIQSQNNVLVS